MSGTFFRVALVNNSAVREHEGIVAHPNGRRVQYAIVGARDLSKVVFYSHGFPACRLEASIAHGVARDLGLTVVALDRPGFGGSDWYKERRIEDWSEDVRLVADALGVSSFGVLGVSGGTPTAVATAALLSDRVSRLAVVSGMGPTHEPGALDGMHWVNKGILRAGQRFEGIGQLTVGAIATLWRTVPGAAEVWFSSVLPAADRPIVARSEVRVVLARNVKESLRPGVRGVMTEFNLLLSDWRGLPPKVTAPTTIWHGDEDTYVPISMAKILHKMIPQSRFEQVKGGGHFMIVDRLRPVLELFA
jgi:pimeloyl-ACP methyl ester carboxylesterase